MTRRVALDTNVLVSALIAPKGRPAAVLGMVDDGLLDAVYCRQILDEYEDVLTRPRFRFPPVPVNHVLDLFRLRGVLIIAPKSDILLPDESDRAFYDTAKAGGALLITGNLKHYPDEPFIMSPAAFLAR